MSNEAPPEIPHSGWGEGFSTPAWVNHFARFDLKALEESQRPMLAQSNSSTASALLRFSRWNRFRSIALLFAVGAICSSTSVSQPVQLRDARIDPPNMLALPGHHPQWADVANDEGPLPSTQRLPPLTLVLSRSAKNEANFEKLLRDQQLPASPDYHRGSLQPRSESVLAVLRRI